MFTVTLSSPSYAEWTKVGENGIENTVHVDFERIRKLDGYVYFWMLIDYLKPFNGKNGTMLSGKVYNQGDCKLFRYRNLSLSFHKEPMGRDVGVANNPKNPEWQYPPPNSIIETTLKTVCAR